uniref:C-type lectin domain containing 10A n=1 Tax=Myotis myotis TaxID=51298 RepID=A0A7J7T4D4_MYOMY|nr:C-type lectin domain containing 10A [Myotis myotis]
MSMKHEDLQSLESEKKSQGSRKGLPPPPAFLQHLCSGPWPLLLSLGLILLLMIGICVIGSKNAKIQSDVETLRATFSNFTSNSMAEVQALHSQGGSLQATITSLKAVVANQEQELQAESPQLAPCIVPTALLCVPDYSEVLLQVQQVLNDLTSLNCQMAVLKSNGSQNTCCPTNWLKHEGSCYWFSGTGKPWPEAERYCQLQNAHLVVINSREEQIFVQKHIGFSYTWMGLSDPEGAWKWVDGTDYETNLKNWKPGQPDDWQGHGLGGGEDCAHFHPDGKWNDDVCLRLYRWICEASISRSR